MVEHRMRDDSRRIVTEKDSSTPQGLASAEGSASSGGRFIRRLVILVLVLLVISGGGAYAVRVWTQPLGPDLVVGAPPEERTDSDSRPQCGGPPVMMVLLIGKDFSKNPEERGSYDSGAADVIRLARVDFVSGNVTLLAIPRDLWVPIPGMQEYGVAANQLRIAYSYGYTYHGEGQGPILLAETLVTNFDVQIDHYIVLNADTFVQGIDAIGGVDLYLHEDLVYNEHTGEYYAEGSYHFDGEQALAYVRARPGNSSDLERILRQTDLIEAVKEKVFSPAVFPSVPRIVQSMRRSALTDLSPADVSSLLCLGQKISTSDIQTVAYDTGTFEEITSRGGHEIFIPNYEETTAFFERFETGALTAAD